MSDKELEDFFAELFEKISKHEGGDEAKLIYGHLHKHGMLKPEYNKRFWSLAMDSVESADTALAEVKGILLRALMSIATMGVILGTKEWITVEKLEQKELVASFKDWKGHGDTEEEAFNELAKCMEAEAQEILEQAKKIREREVDGI